MVDTYKGSVDVTTWNRNDVQVEAVIESDGSDELVALTEVRIRPSGSTILVESDYSEAKRRMKQRRLKNYNLPSVHYTIRMPQSAELNIDDYKSDIDVEGVAADIDLDTYKGEVLMHDIVGNVRLDTYKGKVRITGLAGSLRADTYKGDIEADFVEFADDTIFDTYRGHIEVTLPDDAGFNLDADLGRRGELDTSFSLSQVRKDDNRYRGSIQGGGPKLEFETYRGRMSVRTYRR